MDKTIFDDTIEGKAFIDAVKNAAVNKPKQKAIIIDIDGVLANDSERKANNQSDDKYNNVENDPVNEEIKNIILEKKSDNTIILLTGRPQELEVITKVWLTKNKVPYNFLFMRENGDHTPNAEYKEKVYTDLIEPEFEITLAIDDKTTTSDMWAKKGIEALMYVDNQELFPFIAPVIEDIITFSKEPQYEVFRKKVKVLEVGKYKNNRNGEPQVIVTDKTLDGMVEAYNDFKDNTLADLVIDHEDTKEARDKKWKITDPDGKEKPMFERLPYSVGKWINFVREGNSLYADLVNVLEPVKKILDDKVMTTLSPEFWLDMKSNVTNKVYAGLMTGVAILPGGKWPELFDKLKPYMFNSNSENQPVSVSFSLDGFDCKQKVMCQLQDLDEEIILSVQNDSENKINDDNTGGVKVSDPVNQDKEKFNLDAVMKRLDNLETENTDLKTQLFSRVTSTEEKMSEENKTLRESLRKRDELEAQKDVLKFVRDDLIKDGKFDPADEAEIVSGLVKFKMDGESKKITFSAGSETVEKSSYDWVTGILGKVKPRETFAAHNPIVKSGDGITVTKQDIQKFNDATPDSIYEVKKLEKFALTQNKSIDKMSVEELTNYSVAHGLLAQ